MLLQILAVHPSSHIMFPARTRRTLSFNMAVMNLQLNFSPKLTTRSLDLALTSRLKRFAAMT